jgi:hypothetical protein
MMLLLSQANLRSHGLKIRITEIEVDMTSKFKGAVSENWLSESKDGCIYINRNLGCY